MLNVVVPLTKAFSTLESNRRKNRSIKVMPRERQSLYFWAAGATTFSTTATQENDTKKHHNNDSVLLHSAHNVTTLCMALIKMTQYFKIQCKYTSVVPSVIILNVVAPLLWVLSALQKIFQTFFNSTLKLRLLCQIVRSKTHSTMLKLPLLPRVTHYKVGLFFTLIVPPKVPREAQPLFLTLPFCH
jgi:hypothetical protein